MKFGILEQINPIPGAITLNKFAYSLHEIAKQTGLSTAFLRKEARLGNLITKKFGARRLVLNEDLRAYLGGETDEPK